MHSKEFRLLLEQINELKNLIEVKQRSNSHPEETLLDSDQMERLLKCSPSTLYRLRKSGNVPCVRIGGKYYYPKIYFTNEVIKSISKIDPTKKFDE